MRERYKDEGMAPVVQMIFSHLSVSKKNQLIIRLIDHVCQREPGIMEDLSPILNALTVLNKSENAKVALRARQVLVSSHQPPFALRHNQMESIFLSAIDIYSHEFQPNVLSKLIISETSIFDVLHQFFYHQNPLIRRAALEVYVRRAYISYEMVSLQHSGINMNDRDNAIPCAVYHFLLPTSHPSSSQAASAVQAVSSSSYDDTPYFGLGNYRVGMIASFQNMQQLDDSFSEVLNLIQRVDEELNGTDSVWSVVSSGGDSVTTISSSDQAIPQKNDLLEDIEPIYIVNITIKCEGVDDGTLTKQFEEFCRNRKSELEQHSVRRLTFVVCDRYRFPRYFTYRFQDGYIEDKIYRHLEPALAFQLEINRLRNYDLEAVPTASQNKMHLYLGKAKVRAPGQQVNDFRFFVRTTIRHSDLITKEASYEFLQNEGLCRIEKVPFIDF